MDLPGVGVLSDDAGLLLALGRLCPELTFDPVASAADLVDHDLGLVDLSRTATSASDLVAVVARTPTVVVVGEGRPAPAGVTVVRRPCTLVEVVAALLATRAEGVQNEVIVLDEPVAAAAPLFAARPAFGTTTEPTGPGTAGSALPSGIALRLARQLREIHALARPLATSTVVTAAIAEDLADALRRAHAADRLCLFGQQGRELLAVAGAVPPDTVAPAGDHPLMGRARARSDGVALSDGTSPDGSVSGLVLVDDEGPVDVVTVAGPDLDEVRLLAIRATLTGQ